MPREVMSDEELLSKLGHPAERVAEAWANIVEEKVAEVGEEVVTVELVALLAKKAGERAGELSEVRIKIEAQHEAWCSLNDTHEGQERTVH